MLRGAGIKPALSFGLAMKPSCQRDLIRERASSVTEQGLFHTDFGRPRVEVEKHRTQGMSRLDVTNLCRAGSRVTRVAECTGRIGLVAHNGEAYA